MALTRANGRPTYHAMAPGRVLESLGSTPLGISDEEAVARLQRYGPNEVGEVEAPSSLRLLLHQFASPIIVILMVATGITAVLKEWVDTVVIAAVLVLNAIIGFTQERGAERSVRALMSVVSPKAHVLREGHERLVESSRVVPGDIVLLESGRRVPADVRLVETNGLEVDESLLTGESLPVRKGTDADKLDALVADRHSLAYAGTVVTSGRAHGVVVATGADTELGAIAGFMRAERQPKTPLQRRLAAFSRVIVAVVLAAAVGAFGIGVARGESASEMFTTAVAVAVSAIPEGLPIAYTITLALGVRRMAARRAIVRSLPAVETLGSVTVIGSDKTGTLTENRMTVQEIWSAEGCVRLTGAQPAPSFETLPESVRRALEAGVLASEAHLPEGEDEEEPAGDPTEVALLRAALDLGMDLTSLYDDYEEFAWVPFESERQYSASVRERDGHYVVFVKGAPERVLEMCRNVGGGDEDVDAARACVIDRAQEMADRALRVLGFACAELSSPLESPAQVEEPRELTFVGLTGMIDPPREEVRDAILNCRKAGIRVLMITGDHAITARAIGRRLGLESERVLTGSEMASLDEGELEERIKNTSIFARVSPEQKLRLTRGLRGLGEVVAVTGDGVNDAPALRAADIGVAMGKGGTDVAREAADIVLTDDNFVSVYAAVEEGRITFDNIRKVTFFLVSTGVAEIFAIITALALGWPIPYVAAQILWLNLVTNGLQDVALAFEPGEPNVVRRPPRSPREGILSRLLWERTVVVGTVMAAGTLGMFYWEREVQDSGLEVARTVALTTMVLFQVAHVGNSRSETMSVFRLNPLSNPFLFIATLAAVSVHVLALYLSPTQYVLSLEPIPLNAWPRMIGVALTVVVAVELHKLLRRPAYTRTGLAANA